MGLRTKCDRRDRSNAGDIVCNVQETNIGTLHHGTLCQWTVIKIGRFYTVEDVYEIEQMVAFIGDSTQNGLVHEAILLQNSF